jgi:hypothetical protein
LATGASEVEAFVQANEDLDAALVQQRLGTRLPGYIWCQRRLHIPLRLPLNSNGKYDGKVLLKELKEK